VGQFDRKSTLSRCSWTIQPTIRSALVDQTHTGEEHNDSNDDGKADPEYQTNIAAVNGEE